MKRLISISAFCFLLSAFSLQAQFNFQDVAFVCPPQASGVTNVTNGLVAWWKLDDGSGTTATDSSGSGYNSTLTGSPVPSWISGNLNGGLLFNNTNYVSNPAGIVDVLNTSNSWTVTMWMMSSFTNNSLIEVLFCSRYQTTNQMSCSYSYASGELIFGAYSNNANPTYIKIAKPIPTNTWMHVACVYNGASTSIYTNGVAGTGGGNFPSAANGIYSRFGNSTTSRGVSGFMDDVRVYNRALTAGEVTVLYSWRP